MGEFRAEILERTKEKNSLRIKILHDEHEHLLEVKDYIPVQLFLNGYKLGSKSIVKVLIKSCITGATLGIIKDTYTFRFELVENENTYKSKLTFYTSLNNHYKNINLFIENKKLLKKQVSIKPD